MPQMQPAMVNAGGFIPQVKRLVAAQTEAFNEAIDKNLAWESLLDDIKELYDDHVGQLRRNKHSLLRKLQRQADRDAGVDTHASNHEAARTHAELSLEMEKVVGHHVAGTELEREEWGEKPTVKFFKQAVNSCRSGGITELYRHYLIVPHS